MSDNPLLFLHSLLHLAPRKWKRGSVVWTPEERCDFTSIVPRFIRWTISSLWGILEQSNTRQCISGLHHVFCITICYTLAKKQPPECLRAHSTRAKAATTALACGVPVLDICQAATWASLHTFTKHYCLDSQVRRMASHPPASLCGQ